MNLKTLGIFGGIAAAIIATSPAAMAQHGRGSGGRAAVGARAGSFRSANSFRSAGSLRSRPFAGSRNVSSAARGNWRNRTGGNWHGRHHYPRYRYYYGGYPYFGYPFGYGFYGYGYPYYSTSFYFDDYNNGYGSEQVYQPSSASGDVGSVAAEVQQRLARAGYYHGAIDGVIGNGTRSAIRAYERAQGLPVDGQIDDDLLNRLGVS